MEHIVYEDEYNTKGNKTRIGASRRYAQNLGILVARNHFESMKDTNYQGANFSWLEFGRSISSIAATSVALQSKKLPKNLDELEHIAKNACEIEWMILIEKSDLMFLPVKLQSV